MEYPAILAGLAETWQHTIAICSGLDQAGWLAPTDCPGWRVRDVVAHVAGVEAQLLGRVEMPVEVPDYPWLTSEFARSVEAAVELRRRWSCEQLLAELREVTAARLAMLRDADPEQTALGPLGAAPLRSVVRLRAFDCWVHEQDLRGALGCPGGTGGPAARVAREQYLRALPTVARRAGLSADDRVLVRAGGAVALECTLSEGGPDRGEAAPTAQLRTTFAVLLRLAAGRRDPQRAPVELSGDLAAARRVLGALAVTP